MAAVDPAAGTASLCVTDKISVLNCMTVLLTLNGSGIIISDSELKLIAVGALVTMLPLMDLNLITGKLAGSCKEKVLKRLLTSSFRFSLFPLKSRLPENSVFPVTPLCPPDNIKL